VRRLGDGRLAGGAPYRIVRLSPEGRTGLQALLGTGSDPASGSPLANLTSRLVRSGLLLAPRRPALTVGQVVDAVTVVVPVLGTTGQVRAVLARVPDDVSVVVVDDGSDPALDAAITRRPRTRLVRHERPLGPAAARNAGAASAKTPWVAFVDADVDPGGEWLETLLAHGDPDVVAIAPRIVSAPSRGLAGLVETWSGALDQGATPQDVGHGRPVSFVPTAVLMVRHEAFRAVGGFVEELQVGEDVDLVWRLLDLGRIRYETDIVAVHRPRSSWRSVLKRRFDYGTSAAALESHHPGAVRHADVSIWSLAPWLTAALVRPAAGLAAGFVTVAISPRGLPQLPADEAARLAARGHLLATVGLGRYLVRPLWPLTLALLVTSRRSRATITASIAIGYADAARRRIAADAIRPSSLGALGAAAGKAVVAAVLDDAAYGLGVWFGCLRGRRLGPLLPRIRDLPGLSGRSRGRR
jgi:mycofactocin system glycosyltransferase